MAHLPRWIDDSTVDSETMLSAYRGSATDNEEYELSLLWMIKHRDVSHDRRQHLPVVLIVQRIGLSLWNS